MQRAAERGHCFQAATASDAPLHLHCAERALVNSELSHHVEPSRLVAMLSMKTSRSQQPFKRRHRTPLSLRLHAWPFLRERGPWMGSRSDAHF